MKKGLLLINVGTPEKPDVASVRRYLKTFLSDKRIIDLPAPLRYILLYAFILPFRPKQSAHAYQSIWTAKGSPLLLYSQELVQKLQNKLGETYQVALGMRYSNPDIKQALLELKDCQELTILPIYPQYSSAATGSALEEALKQLQKRNLIPKLRIFNAFYTQPQFIQAEVALIKPLLQGQDHVLFSYHGIPEQQIRKISCTVICNAACEPIHDANTACYRAQCFETSRLLAKALGLEEQQYSTSFQSRLGKAAWIGPFTDTILTDLAAQGIKNLLVVCPSFVADCLETLEEIGIRAKQQWLEAGGQNFTLAPCLNADDNWVDAIISLINS